MQADEREPTVALVPSAFHPSLGGVEELTKRLALEQRRRGASPLVATMRWPPRMPVRSTHDGLPVWRGRFCLPERDVHSLARFAVHAPRALTSMMIELRRRHVDVVHVQCVSNNGLFALLSARLLRLPLVVSLQGELTMDATHVYARSRTLPWLLSYLMEHADMVTACSAQTLSEAEEFTGVTLGERGRVIYNGVDLEEFDTATPESRDRPYVFAIGRHVREKGFDVLLTAYATASARTTHDLVIAGDGPERPDLERLAASLGVAGQVVFVGRTERARTAALFRGCDVFVLPSRHEPMGIVNLEAMAAAKPVIAARVGGVPELVIDGVTGVLIDAEDAEELGAQLDAVLADPSRCGAMGEAGRARAEGFDWTVIAAQYNEIYRRVQRSRSRT